MCVPLPLFWGEMSGIPGARSVFFESIPILPKAYREGVVARCRVGYPFQPPVDWDATLFFAFGKRREAKELGILVYDSGSKRYLR